MQNFWGVNKVYYGNVKVANSAFSLTWSACTAMQIYWSKRKFLHKKNCLRWPELLICVLPSHSHGKFYYHFGIKMKTNMTIVLFFSLSPTANCPCECDGKA